VAGVQSWEQGSSKVKSNPAPQLGTFIPCSFLPTVLAGHCKPRNYKWSPPYPLGQNGYSPANLETHVGDTSPVRLSIKCARVPAVIVSGRVNRWLKVSLNNETSGKLIWLFRQVELITNNYLQALEPAGEKTVDRITWNTSRSFPRNQCILFGLTLDGPRLPTSEQPLTASQKNFTVSIRTVRFGSDLTLRC
jgi:hypothetical protein